jgi:hypothetical protein
MKNASLLLNNFKFNELSVCKKQENMCLILLGLIEAFHYVAGSLVFENFGTPSQLIRSAEHGNVST